MNRLSQRAFKGLLLIAWMAVIYYLSDQPNSNQVTEEIFGSLNYFVRKGSHMAEYAILFWFALWFQSSFGKEPATDCQDADKKQFGRVLQRLLQRFLPPLLLCFFYAVSDEWHQSFVPGRSALFSDILIDMTGSALAALTTHFAARMQSRTS
jgi:hypothetical protein